VGFFKDVVAPGRKSVVVTGSFNTQNVSEWYARNGYDLAPFTGTYDTHSGELVTSSNALELSAVYASTKILGEDMGSMPLFLHSRSADGRELDKAYGHALFPVLHDLVNPDVSAGEFVEALTAVAALEGDGFALIENYGKKTVRLYPLESDESIRVDRDSKRRTVYILNRKGEPKTLTRNQVFHLRGFTYNTRNGDAILQRARHAIGLGMSAQRYAGRFMANDVSAGLFLSHPGVGAGVLGAEGVEGVKQAFREHQGSNNAGEPFVLQEGMTADRKDPDMQKQQLIEQRKFQLEEVARIWRIPLHKLAHLDRSTFSNIEQQAIEYIQQTLNPWRRRWREAVHRHLLTRSEQQSGRLFAEHSVESLLRGDFKAQTDGFRAMLEKGVYTINEVRRWLNMNPVEGGDSNYIQLNMQDITDTAEEILNQEAA
jgi:HK97 family phage portal protein